MAVKEKSVQDDAFIIFHHCQPQEGQKWPNEHGSMQ
jgi:hypothetical protein